MLNIRKLPPPITESPILRNIKNNCIKASTPALLHTAYTRIGGAFLSLLFLIMVSCSNDVVHFVEISEYYAESCHLDQVTQDSIVCFSQKVAAFVAANPLAKEDPLYPRILHNIQASSLSTGFMLNTEWDDDAETTF